MANPTSYASASLYVGDLASEVTEALLFEIFNAVGPVASVRVCRDAATRRSLGYAYVNFHRVEDAERALDTMNFKAIRNRPCRIMWSHRDPTLRKSGLGNVFVKNLAPSIDNKTLYDTFSMFGNILSCKVATSNRGASLGYGFIHYEGEDAANQAISKVDGKVIADKMVSVSVFKSRKERGGRYRFTNVYVKNIPDEVKTDALATMFSQYGEVTSCMVAVDPEGKSRGFGFVNLKTTEEAQQACEALNGSSCDDKKLVVVRAQKKEEREKELKDRFEQLKVERQKKYAGVNLYVKNLSDQITDAKLHEEFSKFGVITSARVMMELTKSRGFGFICFSSPEEATKAVTEMNGRMLDGKPLYVALAQRKEVRRQQLEAQYNSRLKGPMVQPQQMYGEMMQPGPQLGYYPQRNFFPQQMMRAPWTSGASAMMGPAPGFQLMPMGAQHPRGGVGRGGGGPRGRGSMTTRGGGKGQGGMPAPQQQNVKYEQNVRNREQQQRPMQHAQVGEPLTIKALANAPDEQKKQMIGERLFPLIRAQQPEFAGKITGMLLEMDNGELLHLLESSAALKEKVDEALAVLREYQEEQ